MSISGYGLTLNDSVLGDFAGVESVQIGDLVISFDEIKTVSDVNRVLESMPLGAKDGNIDITMKWNRTLYNILRTAALDMTTVRTFTLTDVESSTFVGDGFIETVGGQNLDTNGHAVFTVILRPQTIWAFTAGA